MQDPKQLMEQGWKAREALDFEAAEKLLSQAKTIFEQNEDWFNVTECLNHLAYSQKLRANIELDEGMKLIDEAHKTATAHSTKLSLIMRAEMSLLDAKGNYEKAKSIAEKLLTQSEKPNVKADLLSHLATFSLRTGDIKEAQNYLEQASEFMLQSDAIEKDPIKSIWNCRLLLAKALIAYNSGDFLQAKIQAQQALALATEKDLKIRVAQAQELLDLVELKN